MNPADSINRPGAGSTPSNLSDSEPKGLSALRVIRGDENFSLTEGFELLPGDVIRNEGKTSAGVSTVSKVRSHPSLMAVLGPGALVRVTDRGDSSEAVLGLVGVDGQFSVKEVSEDEANKAEFVITPEVNELSGLFGAALLPSFAGPAAAALGLAALAVGGDDDSGGGAQTVSSGPSGLAGGVNALGEGVSQTPAAPLTGITDPVAGGLGTLGGELSSVNDPSGTAAALGSVVGNPESTAGGSQDGGLVGLLNSVSTGLDEGFSQGAAGEAAPLIDPLSQTLGSDQGQTDGVAQGLANVGSTLSDDTSPAAPLTGEVLGPVVGTSAGQDGGAPQTLDQVSEGLTDLSNEDSAVAPLNAVTEPLGSAVEGAADGVGQLGSALDQATAQDTSGTSDLVTDLLGAETPSSVSSAQAPAQSPLITPPVSPV